LSNEIELSNHSVRSARRGVSIFMNEKFKRSDNKRPLPFLESSKTQRELKHYLKLSVAKQTYSPALSNSSKVSVAHLLTK